MGLLQGKVLSSILFSMCTDINDIEINLMKKNCSSVDIHLIIQYISVNVC